MNKALLAAISVPLLAASCASSLETRKVGVSGQRDPRGIRYSLPVPFILVTPNASGDGGFKVEVIYLADETQTYAVDARTHAGKYGLNVVVKDGLLSKIAWKPDQAAVAAEAIRAASEVAKTELGRVEEKRKKETDDLEKKRASAKATVEGLEKDVTEKGLALKLAQAELDQRVEEKGATAVISAAKLEVTKADLRHKDAQERLAAAKDYQETLGGVFNDPVEDASAASSPAPAPGADNSAEKNGPRQRFWGPVMYRIVDDGHNVRLERVLWNGSRRQVEFPTVRLESPKKPAPAPEVVEEQPWPPTFAFGDTSTQSFTVKLSAPTKDISPDFELTPEGEGPQTSGPVNFTVATDYKSVTVEVTRKLEAKRYQLTLFRRKDGEPVGTLTVPFVVR